MAGIGPPPADKRRRRNEPARGDWVDLSPLEQPIIGELGAEWPDDTLALWETWKHDPVTAQWSEADNGYAMETIKLHAADAVKHASEIRLRMDSLGLTPKGKRDLRWRIVEAEDGTVTPIERNANTTDRRARLSLVT